MVANVETFISQELHNLLFLEEFVFARNKFSPESTSELELADAVVLLGDVLIVYQIKERAKADVMGEDAERRWFRSTVLWNATKQIRDTLKYLENFTEIWIPNERGHRFNLAARKYRKVIKVVIYATGIALPADCASVRHYISDTAGFIHVVNASDYLEIGRTLRVPEEVVRYFEYRQAVIEGFDGTCSQLPEAAIAGHFIGGQEQSPPTLDSIKYLYSLVHDETDWDLAPFLRRLHDTLIASDDPQDYYEILLEFAKLPRSMWRAAKERFRLCIEKVATDTFTQPYRIADPSTGCGFIFIPTDSRMTSERGWREARLRGLQNLTAAHKYDQHLPKCVGCLISKEGEYFDIQWCFMEYEWSRDVEMERFLARSYPFRSVREGLVYGYKMSTEGEVPLSEAT